MKGYYEMERTLPVQSITLPKHLMFWILSHVSKPIAGFEHKRTQSGKYISFEEQLYETYYQVMLIATYFYKRGYSEDKIISVLSPFNHAA